MAKLTFEEVAKMRAMVDGLMGVATIMHDVAFCRHVLQEFADGKREATEFMDPMRAQLQLLEAVDRLLKAWGLYERGDCK